MFRYPYSCIANCFRQVIAAILDYSCKYRHHEGRSCDRHNSNCDSLIAKGVFVVDGIIVAVGIHIIPNQSLTGSCIGICIHEPSCGGVIIAGLEVVEAAFGIVIVPSVAQRVLVGQRTGGGQDLAVGVVGVGRLALMPFPP